MLQINIALNSYNIIICLILLAYLWMNNSKAEKTNRFFISMCLFNIVMTIGDTSAWLLDGAVMPWQFAAHKISLVVYYACTAPLLLSFAGYLFDCYPVGEKIRKPLWRSALVLCGIQFVLSVLSYWNGMYFTVCENNLYGRGNLFWLSQLIAGLIFLMDVALIIICRKRIDKRDVIFLFSYIFLITAAQTVQIFNYGIALTNFGVTIGLLLVFINIQFRRELFIKQQELELINHSLEYLENIMDVIDTSVYVIDPVTYKLLYVNKWLKVFFGRGNDDFTGEFCYKSFRNKDEVCDFCPCKQLKENPEIPVVWEEIFQPHGAHVRHTFSYLNWPNGEKVILQYGIDTTDIHKKVELLLEIERKERELMQKQISIMLSQIQPHFLYNTLVAIRHLCVHNPKLAEETVIEFSDYLRGNMDSLSHNEPIPFEKELAHVETYLKIEKKRFGDKLQIAYDIKAKDFFIPALCLQPIVENAVRYGITKKEHGGTVEIKTEEKEDRFLITVSDNGAGFDVNKKADDNRSHIGIENTRSRLAVMCGGTLDIKSKPGEGTIAVITIPK